MSAEQFANNAISTLSADVAIGATTLTVAAAALFPTVPQFRIRIDSELMLVTAVSGSTFTVTRGVEGTAAASHSSGTKVSQVLTAGALNGALGGQPLQKGTATLVAGTVTVTGVTLTASSVILHARNTGAGTLGNISAPSASRNTGAGSFVISSSSASETSTVDWLIVG